MKELYDIAVLGGGPCGLASVVEAKIAGIQNVILYYFIKNEVYTLQEFFPAEYKPDNHIQSSFTFSTTPTEGLGKILTVLNGSFSPAAVTFSICSTLTGFIITTKSHVLSWIALKHSVALIVVDTRLS